LATVLRRQRTQAKVFSRALVKVLAWCKKIFHFFNNAF